MENFTQINGKNERYLAALNRLTDAPLPFPHPSFPVVALALSGKLYVGGSGAGGWLSAYQTNGHRNWQVHSDGGFAAIVGNRPSDHRGRPFQQHLPVFSAVAGTRWCGTT